ncbi:MAG TPA: PrgI family protein [Candidatus Humimicrobiaceae bacterium]|nr:PrgI family protein [Candidatus Humimicrobiaceae bacterium]
MQFTVPQFTEYETRLVGFLSFRQFVFIAVAGVVCIVLYFLIGEANLFLFLVLSVIVLGAGASLAFLKINGRGLPTVLANFIRFSFGSRFYIWKREGSLITFSKNTEMKKEVKKKEPPLKTTGVSRLKKIRTTLETKTK